VLNKISPLVVRTLTLLVIQKFESAHSTNLMNDSSCRLYC